MMSVGIIPYPGIKEINYLDRPNISISLKFFEIPMLLISVFFMFRGLTLSWEQIYSLEEKHVFVGYLAYFPTFTFMLGSWTLIAIVASEICVLILVVLSVGFNVLSLWKSQKTNCVSHPGFSAFLSIIFPILFPRYNLNETQIGNQENKCQPQCRTKVYFWLAMTKSYFLLISCTILLALYT